jgi:uncharacterized protein (TIGR02246 family)
MKTYIALLLLILIPISLIRAKVSNENQDLQAVRTAIAQGYRHWVEATQHKDVEAVLELYADDAIVLPPGGEHIAGRERIREFYKKYYADLFQLLNEDFSSTSLVLRDDLAIETADYSGEIDRGQKGKSHFKGKNLVVWKREKSGSWKIFRDMWSSSAPQ